MGTEHKRNNVVDAVRGFAILIVVLGHMMTGTVNNADGIFLYRMIWSVQMPLFMLISGYVTKFHKVNLKKTKDIYLYLKKITQRYLYPWFLWTFIIRGIVLSEHKYLDFKWLVYNMDSGYWFLFSLWMINIVFGIARYISEKSYNTEIIYLIKSILSIGICMLVMLLVAICKGFSFFGIKLTLYYMPFFVIGFIFGRYQEYILDTLNKKFIHTVMVLFFVIWVGVNSRVNLYTISDNISGIFVRFVTAICGCAFIIFLINKLFSTNFFFNILSWAGKNSLEIYLTHYVFLPKVIHIVNGTEKITTLTLSGMLSLCLIYTITLRILFAVIKYFYSNKVVSKVLFLK